MKLFKLSVVILAMLTLIAVIWWQSLSSITIVTGAPRVILDESGLEDELMARTEAGTVLGFRHEEGIVRFFNIPFARPPVEQDRYRAPKPVTPWKDALDVREIGPSCIQNVSYPALADSTLKFQSEDCLSVTVSTPQVDDRKRPVIVWIHGGGWNFGSGTEETNDGAAMSARGDVVVASLQYRLGTVGWLTPADFGETTDKETLRLAQLDVLAGMEWVQSNIAEFGGDPDNVTIMGESAGAFLVAFLMSYPAAETLFDRAILQSGATDAWPYKLDRQEFANRLMAAAGISSVEDLRGMTSEDISQFEATSLAVLQDSKLPDPMPWYALSLTVDDIIASSKRGKALLHGTTTHEYHLFFAGL